MYPSINRTASLKFSISGQQASGHRLTDNILKRMFFNENLLVLNKIKLKYVPMGPIDNNITLVQIMTWRQTDEKPLSESMMA